MASRFSRSFDSFGPVSLLLPIQLPLADLTSPTGVITAAMGAPQGDYSSIRLRHRASH
jgi:hypothetical protein